MLARGFAVLFSTVVLAACAQTTGEVCEVDGDCESGLTCCKDTSSSRGTCDRADRCADIISHDAGPIGVDAQVPPDAQIDASGPGVGQVCGNPDAGLTCAPGLECFRGLCLLPADSGPPGTDSGPPEVDSGAPEDGGTDAGEDAGLDGGA